MKKNKKNKNTNKKGLLIIVLLMVIGNLLVFGGIFISFMTTPRTIIKTSLNKTYSSLKDIVLVDRSNTDLGSSYTIDSNIDLKVDGTVFNEPDMVSFKNLNNTKTNILFSQDLSNKKLLFKAKSNMNNSEWFNYKYLIQQSTGYYYLKEFSDNYINVGTNNYFENINDNSYENYNYVIEKILDFAPKNMSDNHLTKEKVSTNLDDNTVSLVKTTYVIDNKELIDLINKIKKDLSNDEKAKEIITNIDKDFFKDKISNDRVLLNKNKYIVYSVYTDMLYKVKKIELSVEDNDESNVISYEILKDSYLIKLIDKDVVKYKYYITTNNDKYTIDIKNGSGKELGKIEFENTEKKMSLSYQMMDEDYKVDLSYSRNLNSIINNKSYKSKGVLNINITDLKTTDKYLLLTMNIDSNYSNKSDIDENTSKTLLKSSFTEEDNERLNGAIDNIINKVTGSE